MSVCGSCKTLGKAEVGEEGKAEIAATDGAATDKGRRRVLNCRLERDGHDPCAGGRWIGIRAIELRARRR